MSHLRSSYTLPFKSTSRYVLAISPSSVSPHSSYQPQPISFDVFTQLTAHEPGASSGKFKFHLRALLDKLAINFYGAEGISWKPTKK